VRPALRDLLRSGVTVLVAALAAAAATMAGAAGLTAPTSAPTAPAPAAAPTSANVASLAIIVRDQTALRAAPHESAQQQALLWQGEVVEVRGERIDHLQVWDYQRERGGFVEASRVRRTTLAAGAAPELLAVLRFVRDAPGSEALGIGLAAAYLKAAPAEALQGAAGAEAFDAIGTMADRLGRRASSGSTSAPGGPTSSVPSRAETALAAHLEVVARYGVAFKSFERDGVMRICYDGEAFRRVLAMPSADATQRARAALGLTRPECLDPALPVSERQRIDAWRAEVLDRVDTAPLAKTWKSRVAMRRAGVWSGLAFQRTRRGDSGPAEAAARRALVELADVDSSELADDDVAAWNDAALRVGASRWAAAPMTAKTARTLRVVTAPGEPGQTCVSLVDSTRSDSAAPLARRCTYGVVWTESAVQNREGNALALAVQPMEAWRELWVFTRQSKDSWSVQMLPPSTATPELGYAEFAGWVPGGKQMLVAREARGATGLKRNFEVVRLATLGTDRQAGDPSLLGPFMRWQDAGWKRETVSVR
jgi:hypothetical protein